MTGGVAGSMSIASAVDAFGTGADPASVGAGNAVPDPDWVLCICSLARLNGCCFGPGPGDAEGVKSQAESFQVSGTNLASAGAEVGSFVFPGMLVVVDMGGGMNPDFEVSS